MFYSLSCKIKSRLSFSSSYIVYMESYTYMFKIWYTFDKHKIFEFKNYQTSLTEQRKQE